MLFFAELGEVLSMKTVFLLLLCGRQLGFGNSLASGVQCRLAPQESIRENGRNDKGENGNGNGHHD
jgi:hypothetical protein